MRVRFALCAVLVAALLCALGWQFQRGFELESNILSLVPAATTDPGLEQAQTRHADLMSRRIVFLIGSHSEKRAAQAARRFTDQLASSAAISKLSLQPRQPAPELARALMPYRLGLLSDRHRRALLAGETDAVLQEALQGHFSLAGAARVVPAAQDLAGLLSDHVLASTTSPGRIESRDGLLWVDDDTRHWVLVQARLAGNPFEMHAQSSAMQAIDQALAGIASPGIEILRSGVLFHAAHATQRAKTEIAAFSILATLLVVALLWHALGSPLPLLLSVGILALGIGAGALACQWVFGKVHLITLVFGTSLIGVGIDYALHFYCDQFRSVSRWTPALAFTAVGGAILIGHLTTVLGYASLLLTPFPGLRQMALFSIVGLVTTCACVLCLLPLMPLRTRKTAPAAMSLSNALASRIAPARRSIATGLLVLLLALAVTSGLYRLSFEDDIRVLQIRAPQLFEQDRRVQALTGTQLDSRFLLAYADDEESLLQTEESLLDALRPLQAQDRIGTVSARAQVLPSQSRQLANRALQKELVWSQDGLMSRLMRALGANDASIAKALSRQDRDAPLLTPERFAQDHPHPLDALWLGPIGRRHFSVIALSGINDPAALHQLADSLDGVELVDRVGEISRTMRDYRQQVLRMLGVVTLVVFALLAWRYGSRAALRTVLPPIGGCVLALAVLGWSGVAANLFSVLALLMLLGLGVDYGVFLREAGQQAQSAMLAVCLSATTTIFAFGLLALSATPFLASIGLTLAGGVLAILMLALWLRPPAESAP